jgi:hypothetical protein
MCRRRSSGSVDSRARRAEGGVEEAGALIVNHESPLSVGADFYCGGFGRKDE